MTIFHTGLKPEEAILKRLRLTHQKLTEEANAIKACLQAQDPGYPILGKKVRFTFEDEEGEFTEEGYVDSIRPCPEEGWIYEYGQGMEFYDTDHKSIKKYEVL